jgi:hypothetical protein
VFHKDRKGKSDGKWGGNASKDTAEQIIQDGGVATPGRGNN